MVATENIKKTKITEKDLIKMCIDSPQYLSKTLGHGSDPVSYENHDERKQMLKFIYKSWSGITKYIKR